MPMNWSELNEGKDLRESGSRIFGATDQSADCPSFFEIVESNFFVGRGDGEPSHGKHIKYIYLLLIFFD